jgi:hypothetical protein
MKVASLTSKTLNEQGDAEEFRIKETSRRNSSSTAIPLGCVFRIVEKRHHRHLEHLDIHSTLANAILQSSVIYVGNQTKELRSVSSPNENIIPIQKFACN